MATAMANQTERQQILLGDCREILPTLEVGSVQCCVTSPPYWGLRDYGTATWEGGLLECDHLNPSSAGFSRRHGGEIRDPNGFHGSPNSDLKTPNPYRKICAKCGARRIDSQLGLESTPEEFIAKMVAVFREVWRVLRDDGTLWINLGDSYAQSGGQMRGNEETKEKAVARQIGKGSTGQHGGWEGRAFRAANTATNGLKPKDLCMMPARVAMALQADGWYLRSDIIWHKPNPMPESVTDRPTKSHEYIFLLTKQQRYFYDADAIRELAVDEPGTSRGGTLARIGNDPFIAQNAHRGPVPVSNGFRNKRTVWTVATQAYSDAHFATFPEDLIKPCILAGSCVGDTVLDPFAGSGTTGKVALELGRKAILIELNPAYIELAHERTNVTPGFF